VLWSFAEPLILLLDIIEQHEVIEAALAIHLDPVSRWLTLACIWVPLYVSIQFIVDNGQEADVVREIRGSLPTFNMNDFDQS
jgi:hypothetical protein